ncbi:MAG: glycosyltransferase [Anaerolineae bacterium]
MKVSLVFTVLNESASLPALLDSIAAQTRLPDEVVACDGGSDDETVDLLRAEARFSVRVIVAPGANISQGRNQAIAAARHDLIACTDAGVRLDPRWLESIVQPIDESRLTIDDSQSPVPSIQNPKSKIQNPHWVAGFFLPDPRPGVAFDVAMSATALPLLDDIHPEHFLPSSRSLAFRKPAWQSVGGYPEWLDYCEDLIFDFKLRDVFGAPAFAPDAIAYFRPRTSLASFFKQYYRYARGDGKANLWLKRHLARYATYLGVLPALLAGILFGTPPALQALCAGLLALGAAVYLRAPYRRLPRLWQSLSAGGKVKAAVWIPIIRVTGDIAKMLGYPVGLRWRLRRRQTIGN